MSTSTILRCQLQSNINKILTNKTFLLIISILTFIFTLILVSKTFYLKNIVDHYEEYVTEISKKRFNRKYSIY